MSISHSICFIVSSPFTVNGFLINHLKELTKLYRVTLCVNLHSYKLSPELNSLDLRIIHVPLERKISLMKDLNAWCALFKIFRNGDFESVHSMTPKAGLLAMSAAFFAEIPNRFHTFTGQIWPTRRGLDRYFFKLIDCLIVRFASYLFADSSSQINFLIEEKVCNLSKIQMLGTGSISGVDLEKFRFNPETRHQLRNKFSIDYDDCIFLFVGRLCKDKGLFDLLEAFSLLSAKYQHVALWILGPDEEQIEAHIKHQFPHLHSIINWIGPTFYPGNWMVAADILVLPSYREGFGTVIIEAASCGLPAIAYRINGVIDAVVDGETGLLVEVGDVLALSKQMEHLVTDPNLRAYLAFSAKKRADSQFSSKVVTKAWLDFYSIFIKN
jgi:glycosyltransferase involved in cell wall biosynthesis